jgi:dethiobiotin synthetase
VRIVVIGTGTEVGKTHVTCALLAEMGSSASAWKPVESGGGDTEALTRAGKVHPARYSFDEAISPHLAARRRGAAIDLDEIVALADRYRPDLIETAGGLFSPLGAGITNLDLVLGLAPAHVLLVAPDRLGVLHDVGATLRGAKAAGLTAGVIVLSEPAESDESTGTNAGELAGVLGIPVAAVFPRAAFDAPASRIAAKAALAALSSIDPPGSRRRSPS